MHSEIEKRQKNIILIYDETSDHLSLISHLSCSQCLSWLLEIPIKEAVLTPSEKSDFKASIGIKIWSQCKQLKKLHKQK